MPISPTPPSGALGCTNDQAAGFIDGVERAFDGCGSRPDRNPLAEAKGALQPQLSDVGKAAAIVPDAAEFDPGVRERRE
jgi:hypothetical protein